MADKDKYMQLFYPKPKKRRKKRAKKGKGK